MRGWKIGSFGGIDIEINYTWLFLFALLTWSMSVHLRHAQEGLTEWVYWTGGVLTSLLFLASVLAQEMRHSLLARSLGMGVKRITLFIFGGVSQIEGNPARLGSSCCMTCGGTGNLRRAGVIFTGLARMGSSVWVAASGRLRPAVDRLHQSGPGRVQPAAGFPSRRRAPAALCAVERVE